MRGGTSRALFFKSNELPEDPQTRDRLLMAALGTPDPRQIDGLGGADILTSKVAIISATDRDDADVEYTFAQVAVDRPIVDYKANCGNISAAVGPYAINEGMVKVTEPITRVRIYSTNSNSIYIAYVPVKNGKAVVEGDYHIDGVPGTGAKIDLDFSGAVGSLGGGLLPTGSRTDILNVPGLGPVKCSIVDVGNCVAFIEATSAGMKGSETPGEIMARPELLERLEKIRGTAAKLLGLSGSAEDAAVSSPARPFLGLVAPPVDYPDLVTGRIIGASEMDLRSTIYALQKIHKAYPVTGTVCAATAALLGGTVVNEVVAKAAIQKGLVRIGHPSGVIESEVALSGPESLTVGKASISRTARMIMDGYVYIRKSMLK